MELHLKIIGLLLIVLAITHIVFPKYFGWKEDLKNITLINKQMMYVHTFFIGVTVFLMGVFCLFNSSDIINTKLGKNLSLGMFVFWTLRLYFQFFIYSTKLWKGKKLETIIHVVFSILWIYLCLAFMFIYLF